MTDQTRWGIDLVQQQNKQKAFEQQKEMREEFRDGKLPKYLTIDDIRTSPFFEKESDEAFKKITENLSNTELPPDLPPLPTLKEPVAEVQPTYGQVA